LYDISTLEKMARCKSGGK